MAAATMELVFATVGTTQFDALIHALMVPSTLEALEQLGCRRLRVQYGRGAAPMPPASASARHGIEIEAYSFKPALGADMDEAGLVISHAGSGSILEALDRRKPLVVVVNEALMDNHQSELADELAAREHLVATRTAGLERALREWRQRPACTPLPAADPLPFCAHVDALIGVSTLGR
jgi:beta-1,4-N-acetylglucosaminyltransferase